MTRVTVNYKEDENLSSFGRNGHINTKGAVGFLIPTANENANQMPKVMLVPITSKGKMARNCYIEIPLQELAHIVQELSKEAWKMPRKNPIICGVCGGNDVSILEHGSVVEKPAYCYDEDGKWVTLPITYMDGELQEISCNHCDRMFQDWKDDVDENHQLESEANRGYL